MIFALAAIISASCAKPYEQPTVPPAEEEVYNVQLSFSADQTAQGSITDLQPINDINLYAIHLSSKQVRHYYVRYTSTLKITLPPGKWEIYSAANISYDLGQQSAETIPNVQLNMTESSLNTGRALPMSDVRTIEISQDTSLGIDLKCTAAIVNVNVALSETFSKKASILTIQPVSIPVASFLFRENTAEESNRHYTA